MKTGLVVAVSGLALVAGASADEITRYTFDTAQVGGRNVSFVTVPDLSSTPTDPGTFPGSSGDVWGVVDDNVNDDFLDDTVLDPFDQFGVLPANHIGRVFGAEDLMNPDNPLGTASASWVFDVSGFTGLSMSIDFAAMGNFDTLSCPLPPCFPDSYDFTVSMDGGPESPLFTSGVSEGATQTYTLQSGLVVLINDPLTMNGVALRNTFQTITAPIPGAGSYLTLTLRGQGESSEEVLVFDSIILNGTPGTVCDTVDFNHDGLFPDTMDIDDFLLVFSGGACSNHPNCGDVDFNNDGLFPDTTDIEALLQVFSGGNCF